MKNSGLVLLAHADRGLRIELVEQGESVIIARNGLPVAEIVAVRRKGGFPFGIASKDPLVPPGDEWWQPMTEEEVEDWIDGK